MKAILKMQNGFFESKPISIDNVHKSMYISLGKNLQNNAVGIGDIVGVFEFEKELGIIEVDNGRFEKLVLFTLKGFRI